MATGAVIRRATQYSWGFYLWIVILGALVIQGLYSFARLTSEGHHLTGLSDAAPWGLFISGFVFFVGASAGATVIGLMIHAFGREDYAPLGTRAILIGLLSLMAAVLLITVDVGSIPRMLRLPFVWRNFSSAFTYTSITYYVFGLLMLVELYFTMKITRRVATDRDKKLAKWLAIAAVPFALVILHAPHGGLFAVVIARDFWNTPLLPPHFAVAALATGTAIVLLVAIVTSALTKRDLVTRETAAHIGKLLALFIGIAGFLDAFDFMVFRYGELPAHEEAWQFLKTNHLPLTILHVGGYIVAFAILLSKWGRTIPGLTVASVLALAGLAAYRYNLTVVGLDVPLFPFLEQQRYYPTWTEISVAIGIVALVALAYSVLTKVLPMEENHQPSI